MYGKGFNDKICLVELIFHLFPYVSSPNELLKFFLRKRNLIKTRFYLRGLLTILIG